MMGPHVEARIEGKSYLTTAGSDRLYPQSFVGSLKRCWTPTFVKIHTSHTPLRRTKTIYLVSYSLNSFNQRHVKLTF